MKLSRILCWLPLAMLILAASSTPALVLAQPTLGTYTEGATGNTKPIYGITLIANGGTTGTYIDGSTGTTRNIVGASLIDGSGNVMTLGCQVTLACQALSLAINGATIGTNALAVNGTSSLSGNVTFATDNTYSVGSSGANRPANIYAGSTINAGGNISTGQTVLIGGASGNAKLAGPALNVLQLGNTDQAAPNAQTLGVQNVLAGTTNTAGVNFNINGSAGTGTGAGGSIVFQVAPAGTTGSAQNAFTPALTLDSTKTATFFGTRINLGGATSSFPALKFSTSTIEVRLADDSARADIAANNMNIIGYMAEGNTTVASLLTCNTTNQYKEVWVTDATQTFSSANFGTTPTGGGSNKVPVKCDGTSWKIG